VRVLDSKMLELPTILAPIHAACYLSKILGGA